MCFVIKSCLVWHCFVYQTLQLKMRSRKNYTFNWATVYEPKTTFPQNLTETSLFFCCTFKRWGTLYKSFTLARVVQTTMCCIPILIQTFLLCSATFMPSKSKMNNFFSCRVRHLLLIYCGKYFRKLL